jgi:hypothetical protein
MRPFNSEAGLALKACGKSHRVRSPPKAGANEPRRGGYIGMMER